MTWGLIVTQTTLLCPIKEFFLSQGRIPLVKNRLRLINLIKIVITTPKPSLRLPAQGKWFSYERGGGRFSEWGRAPQNLLTTKDTWEGQREHG